MKQKAVEKSCHSLHWRHIPAFNWKEWRRKP